MYDYRTARRVIDDLTAIDAEPGTPEFYARVEDAVRGIGFATFTALDEKPGFFDGRYAEGDWHWKLRRTRNNGPDSFFDSINEKEAV